MQLPLVLLSHLAMAMSYAPAQADDAATAANPAAPTRIEVELSNFAFAPAELRLSSGRPYLIRFVNRGSGGHNFAAPAFFAAARIPAEIAAYVKGGRIELEKGESVEIALVPSAGTY